MPQTGRSAGPGQGGVGPAAAHFIDMGWWRAPGGRRALLTWDTRTGALFMGQVILAVITDELEMRRRLDGWVEHAGTPEGSGWLAQRLEDYR